jgi:hypothetical protein
MFVQRAGSASSRPTSGSIANVFTAFSAGIGGQSETGASYQTNFGINILPVLLICELQK